MTDLSQFDPNSVGNPNNNIFGLPFTEEEARLVILPIPWEVTVSYNAGTARAPEHIFKASLQVDLFDPEIKNAWKQGYFMRSSDKKILMKSDYLRKEAELYINYISEGEDVNNNKFMCKTLKEVNAGGIYLNDWVYEQTKELMAAGKLVALLGGDHSTPLGYFKAIAEKHGDFGILQIDAHCDLRKAYENFVYSHASIMYNALEEISRVLKTDGIFISTIANPYYAYPVGVWKRGVIRFLFRQMPKLKLRPFHWFSKHSREFTWNETFTSYFYPIAEQISLTLKNNFSLAGYEDLKMDSDSTTFDMQYQLFRFPIIVLLSFKKLTK